MKSDAGVDGGDGGGGGGDGDDGGGGGDDVCGGGVVSLSSRASARILVTIIIPGCCKSGAQREG